MSKKKIWVLVPLGLLLLSLVVLAGCRPSMALTRMMNAMNALNPGTEETMTEEEQEEQESSDQVDPMDEEEENAKIEELDQLIGQLLENMDQEEAEEAVKAMYAAAAQAHEWGSQEYNPENLDTSTDSGALALNIWDDVIRSESNLSNGYVSSVLRGTGIVSDEGVVSSSGGTASGGVSVRPGGDGDGSGTGGGDSSDSFLQGVDRDKEPTNDGETPPDTITNTGGEGNSDGGGSPGGDNTPQPTEEETSPAPSPTVSESEPPPDTTQKDPDEFKSDKPGGVSGHKIAAAGDAAVMVCMLGGSDRLVASSPDFLNNSYIQQGFNSGGQLNDCATLWTDSGDGSWEMSETEFIYLMQVVQPDVCIEVSGTGSFSEEQIDRMINWYGVSHYVVAAPTTGDSVVGMNGSTSMMTSLATIMDETEDGTPASEIAKEYVDFYYITILGHVSGTTHQRTVFIEDWDYDAQVVFNEQDQYGDYNTQWEYNGWQVPVGSGCAVIKIGWGFRPLREFLVDADVYDWAVFPATIYTSNEFNDDYGKGQNIGEKENLQYCWFQSTANGDNGYPTKSGDLCYVTPVFRMLKGTMVSNSYNGNLNYDRSGYYSGLQVVGGRSGITEINNENIWKENEERIVNGDLSFGFIHPGYTGDRGGGSFVYVIAKNQSVAQELENQKGKSSSAWYVSGSAGQDLITKEISYGYGYVEEYGTLVNPQDLGNLHDMSYYTTVEGDYTILTNPTGLFCDWVDGSPESILETAWAACEIQHCQGYDEAALRQDIHDFYQKFYGLDIGLYSTEMNTILAGPVS